LKGGEMTVYEAALQLQQDLIERPNEKPRPIRKGTETRFIQTNLAEFGYELTKEKIRLLTNNAASYQSFILAATK
jgi:hypothetical protein